MVRVNLFITERQLAALRKESKRSGLSVAELVRRALDAILKESK